MSISKAAGIVWYKNAGDYAKALSIFTDAFLLPPTYQEFLVDFDRSVAMAEAMGWIAVKAELDPETFSAWCESRSLNVDAHGRAEWGSLKAIEYLKSRGHAVQ